MCFERIPEQDSSIVPKDLKVDEVTWQTYIRSALQKYHGLFGLAITVEVVKTMDNRAMVRLQNEDIQVFSTSITTYVANLDILGFEGTLASIKYNSCTPETNL